MKGTAKSRVLNYLLTGTASVALLVAACAQNSACFCIAHQDKTPDAAKRLRRF